MSGGRGVVYNRQRTNDSDAYTQAGLDRQMAGAVQWVQACQKVGSIPALLTPLPQNGTTSGQEAFRRQGVQSIKDICAALGVACIDRDSIYTDYTQVTGGFKAGLSNPASLPHPNLTGYQLEAELWLPLLVSVVG